MNYFSSYFHKLFGIDPEMFGEIPKLQLKKVLKARQMVNPLRTYELMHKITKDLARKRGFCILRLIFFLLDHMFASFSFGQHAFGVFALLFNVDPGKAALIAPQVEFCFFQCPNTAIRTGSFVLVGRILH